MIEALRFVRGAVARKDLLPALTHFRIENGHVRGFNGTIALSSPIALNLACSPQAVQFIKAIQACDETVQLHVAENGKLVVRAGKFTANVDCTDDPFPNIYPEGAEIALGENFLETVAILAPFIAEDASRPWARGVMFRGCSAFATNNIVIIERWLGAEFPFEINIPKESVAELIRIGVNPIKMQANENSVSFHYEDGRWLRSSVLTTQWPDVSTILEGASKPGPIPVGFFEAVEKLVPFADDVGGLHFKGDAIATSLSPGVGATIEVPGVPATGCFNSELLLALKDVATLIDFNAYPAPCMFYGDKIRGAIVGLRP